MTIFFTADHHLGHSNIIQFCKRPFQNINQMDEELILRWNSKVGPNDIVYHLGDFTLGNREMADSYFCRLNGRIRILPGSHDWRWWDREYHSLTDWRVTLLPPLVELKAHELKTKFGMGQGRHPARPDSEGVIVLCHYAMLTWPLSHYGSYHLFGHSHGKLQGQPNSMDIGVDCTDFYPLSLEEVLGRFKNAVLS